MESTDRGMIRTNGLLVAAIAAGVMTLLLGSLSIYGDVDTGTRANMFRGAVAAALATVTLAALAGIEHRCSVRLGRMQAAHRLEREQSDEHHRTEIRSMLGWHADRMREAEGRHEEHQKEWARERARHQAERVQALAALDRAVVARWQSAGKAVGRAEVASTAATEVETDVIAAVRSIHSRLTK